MALTIAFLLPGGAAMAADTGWKSPTANAWDSGGSGWGWGDAANAHADGGGHARGIGNGTSHRWYNYGISIPAGATISGIEVRADWWLFQTGGTNSLGVQLSWNGGSSWTSAKTDTVETTTEHTGILGSSTDKWGRTWATNDFTNANFRVRVVANTTGAPYYQEHKLDWIPVKVNYTTSGGDTTPPAAPVNLVASAAGCSQIDLDWSDNAETDLASYSVYRSTTSGFTPSSSNRIAMGVTTSAYSNTGLAASTQYFYKVTALDTSGNESAASVQASAMTTGSCDTTPPAAPTGLTATSVSASQINLDWTDNSETDLGSYSVYRSTTSGFTPSPSNRIATGLATSAYNNTGLAASTTYFYKVTAADTSGNESTPSAQASATTAAGGGGTPTPPAQPTSGPAGSDYPHGDWIVSSGGSGNNAWHVFQPTNPRPASAPVAVMLHGYGEWSGYNVMHNMIRHTVRKGYIVVYPRWQTGVFSPGTSMTQTLPAAVNGIKGGLDWLQADTTNRVQPQLDKVSYMGHSYGGMIAANVANRHVSLGVPAPKALYLFEPFGGGAGDQFDADMNGVPSTTKVSCQISEKFTDTSRGCFSLYPMFGHIVNANKDFVVSYSDTRGSPTLVADHFSICSPPAGAACYAEDPTDPNRNAEQEKRTDAQDFFAHWKRWVAIQSCANNGTLCEYGLNDTPENRHMGVWSDGVPVREQRITDSAVAP